MMWTLVVTLLFVSAIPGETPLFGHQIVAPVPFESESACRAFRSMLKKKLPADFGIREIPVDEPGPGFRVSNCKPPEPLRAPTGAVHQP